ncbi:MAG: polysaccharide lyase family protein, partial [Terriglobia bacterium]
MKRHLSLRHLPLLTLIGLMFTPLLTRPAENTLWQIGKFDRSSYEFRGQFHFSDPQFQAVYTIGQSDPAKDWPAMQAGTGNAEAGKRPHPYTIVFNLPAKPKGAYHLLVSAITSHSRTPNLKVGINGKSGLFYLDRKVSYYAGDNGFDSPVYSTARLEVTLPTSALQLGQNRLVLTAVDDPADGPGDSWLTYDALSLTNDTNGRAGHASRPASVEVKPTDFYVSKDNQLAELISVTV